MLLRCWRGSCGAGSDEKDRAAYGSTRVIFGWDAGVALYIALIYLIMAQGSIAKIRRRAAINDEGATALLVLTAGAALASLASVLAELGHSPSPYQISLGIATILLSWMISAACAAADCNN